MNFEKKMKKHINQTMDEYVPNPYPTQKRRMPLWGKLVISTVCVGAACAVIVPIALNFNNLEKAISKLSGTKVDMTDVEGFAVWNGNYSKNEKPQLSSVKMLKSPSFEDEDSEPEDSSDFTSGDSGDSTSEEPVYPDWWTEEDIEQYEWEQDYDWDPVKASVLVSLDDNGKIKEVIYERTNNKGVIKQDTLGNAVAVYTTKSFTFVMYVNDSEWEFWDQINYAQYTVSPSGFSCHHEMEQTIVIYNKTGQVFPLKDIFPYIDRYSHGKNYTLQVNPFYDDILLVNPMYGDLLPQWYKIIFDEVQNKIDYVFYRQYDDLVCYSLIDDNYGQKYLLKDFDMDRTVLEYRELREFTVIEEQNALYTPHENVLLKGTDGYVYAIQQNKLCVFGENFELTPIKPNVSTKLTGISDVTATLRYNPITGDNGAIYQIEGGYLFSALGYYWKIEEDGFIGEKKYFDGSFPRYCNDVYIVNNEIIAFVDTEDCYLYSVDGRLIDMKFSVVDGVPTYEEEFIMDSTELWIHQNRIIALDDVLGGYDFPRGETKYYLIKVVDGVPTPEYIAYGDCGGIYGLVNPVIEPIDLSDY